MAKKKIAPGKKRKKPGKKAVKKPAKAVLKKKPIKKTAAPDLFENVHRTRIRVVGIGGGGGNIVAEIVSRVPRLDFVSANTDKQALRELPRKVKTFSFGQDLTHGLGCGMDADLGERAARAEKEKIKKVLEGSDICIFISSLGGGTGSGAAPVFAEVAHELHILSIGIFTMPFSFEGDKRRQLAEASLEKLKPHLNTYIIVPNENIFRVIDAKTPLKAALSSQNRKLADTFEGFMETLASAGLINIDFADVQSVLEGRGRLGFINTAQGSGATKGQDAVGQVLANPLYEYGIEGADRILFNIVGDRNLKMQEVARVSKAISDFNPKARIIFGISCAAPRLKDKIRITLFAVGCGGVQEEDSEGKEERASGKKKGKGAKKSGPKKGKVRERTSKNNMEEKPPEGETLPQEENPRVRRNAVDVKNAIDEELHEMEKKEKQWDVPAFLRNK